MKYRMTRQIHPNYKESEIIELEPLEDDETTIRKSIERILLYKEQTNEICKLIEKKLKAVCDGNDVDSLIRELRGEK